MQKTNRKQQPEYRLQCQVCQYIDFQYPEVMYISDTIASVKLTIPQQVRNKKIQKDGFKCPDLLIFESRNGYHGLFIELKVETPFKKDGTLKKNEHLDGQQKTINRLKAKGYKALFSWGFEMTKKIIDDYLNLEK